MSIDSINYGRELRNIFAEIKSMRAEVADMQSALLSVQEQYGYAVVELLNRSNEFDKEISEIKSQLQNYYDDYNDLIVELANLLRNLNGDTKKEIEQLKSDLQQKLDNLKIQSEKIFTRQNEQSDFITDLMNENLDSVQERFSQLEKTLAENLDKINSRYTFSSQQNEITNKNLSALEELLRLIAANQLLNEVEKNLPQKKSLPNVSSGKKKKIFIFGSYNSFRENLAELLKCVIQNIELTVTGEVGKCRDADLIIYPVPPSLYSFEANEFFKLLQSDKKILMIIDQNEYYPTQFKAEKQYLSFKSELARYCYTYPSDWKNVSVIYVSLEVAKKAWTNSNFDLFRKSCFHEIEQYINSIN